MDRSNQAVVGKKCVKNETGELSLGEKEKMKGRVEHYARLLNIEWPSDVLPEDAPVEG